MLNSDSKLDELSDNQFTKLINAINDVHKEAKQIRKEVISENNKLRTEFQEELSQLREEIKQVHVHHFQETEKQGKEIEKLSSECERLQQRCLNFERILRKNNLIIFGLEVQKQTNLFEFVTKKINEHLNIIIDESEVRNLFILKVDSSTPIKIEFHNVRMKELLLKSAYKLKNTNIVLADDLCFEDRQDKKIILRHYKQVKFKNCSAKIKGHTLIVNNKVWTVQDLKQGNVPTDLEIKPIHRGRRSSSLPNTSIDEQETLTKKNIPEVSSRVEYGNSQQKITTKTVNINKNSLINNSSLADVAGVNGRSTRQKAARK